MAILLSIETATQVCSVAIHEDEKLLGTSELHIAQIAGSKLADLIDHLMKSCSITSNQLDAIGISSGPGSYTGLRIGIATAKGLCLALNVPLISVNTLELMAFQVAKNIRSFRFNVDSKSKQILLCPMLDARRMEVYTLLTNSELQTISPTEAMIIDEHSFERELNKNEIFFFGNGSKKCFDVIKHSNAYFVNDIIPSAASMGELIFEKWRASQFEDLITFEPFYLKDFMIRKPKEA